MAFTPAPGVAEVVMHYGAIGGPVYNIYHVWNADTTEWDAGDLTTLCGIFNTWEGSTALSHRHNEIFPLEVRARDLTIDNGAEVSLSMTGTGSAAGNPLPNNVTLAIKASTGIAGRSFRGRSYWIGLSSAMVNNDQVATASATALVTAMNDLMAAVNAHAPWLMVVLSGQLNKAKLNPRVPRPIANYLTTDTNVDSQRRRLTAHNIHR